MQELHQDEIVVEVPDLATLNKKSAFRVLHVDDDMSMLEISKQILMDMGNFDIDTVCCVDEAFRKLSESHYEAVISDYEMPTKDGLQFLQELREQKNEIPFVLFTGKGREDVAIKALNLGADRYINKQGNPETVYGELSDALVKTIEHKRSKRLHAESESKYCKLVENSLQGIAIIQGPSPKFVFANSAMGKLFGYSPLEMMALSPEQIAKNVHPDDRETFFDRFRKRLEGKEVESTYKFRGFRKDGKIRWLEVCANLIEYNGHPAVQGVFLDITESKRVGETLRESEKRYRELANCLPYIVFETDLNGQLKFVNERATEISGYSLNEIEKGQSILQFLVPEDRERATKNIQRLLSGSSNVPTEYTFLRKDGTTFPALITATPRISENKITGLRGLVLDITERKKAEQLLKKNQEQLEAIILNAPIGIAWSDLNKVFLKANEAFCRILGFSENELQKLTFKDITHPEDLNDSNSKMEELVFGRIPFFSQEKRYIRKDGTIINGKVTVSAIRDNNENKPVLFIAELEDITERKRIEMELKQKYDVLERVGESVGAGLAIIGKDYQIFWANRLLRNAVGNSNKKCFQTFNKLDTICSDCGVKKVFEQDVSFDVHEYETINSKGEKVWIELRVTPLKDKNGVTMAALELAVPVTERKKAEDKLRESQYLTQKMLYCSPNLIYIYDLLENCNVYANREVLDFLGYSPEQIKLMGPDLFANILHPDDTEVVAKHHARFANAPDNATYNVEYRMKHSSGEWRWLRSRDTLFARTQDGIGKQILGMCEDITERKNVKLALAESEKKFRNLAEESPNMIFINHRSRVVYANKKCEEIMGYTKEEFYSAGFNFLSFVSPEYVEVLKSAFAKHLRGEDVSPYEYVLTTRDGKKINVIITTKLIEYNGEQAILGIVTDITENKRAADRLKTENAQMESMNEKLRVVGGLTRHDVGNKLMAIKANAYLLKKRIGDNAELAKYLAAIYSAIDGADDIIEFSRAYEKIGLEQLANISVQQDFDEAVALFPEMRGKQAINECRGITVLADSLLRQLFYNLVENSLKHGEKVTQLRLHCRKEKNQIKLLFEDNGVGIPEINKHKIFEKGFSTGKSSGLGLFLIKKIIEVYGWKITETGEPGKGAKFEITIPNVNQNGKENYQIFETP